LNMAATLELRTQDGSTAGTITLDDTIFGIEPNMAVLHQVVTAQLAARRSGSANTKTRAEVRGGGAKPFRQKGTGRARQGSVRAPQFTGGGVVHGPKPRSYSQKVNKKMTRLALHSALSDRAHSERVVVIDAWRFDTPRTKDAISALTNLGLDGKVMMVVAANDDTAVRSFRNLSSVQLVEAGELNAYDVLCSDWLVFTRETLPGGDS
jgi:large subunit ribosomal protein L4